MSDMSFSTVLKNVYTFAQILSQSCTEAVSHWDIKSINNAFNWASYCEQVYDHIKDKPLRLRANLEKSLKEMTSLITPTTCLTLDVDSLCRATEILEEKLMLNTHLKLELFEKIILQKNNDKSIQESVMAKKLHQLILLCNTVEIFGGIITESGGNVYDNPSTIPQQSYILYKHLKQQALIVTKTERYNNYVKGVLSRLSELNGMLIIVCLIAVYEEQGKNTITEDTKLYELIMSWLQKLSTEKPIKLLEIQKDMLCNVAVGNVEFLNLYLQCLINWGISMKPDYSSKYFPKLYLWRFTTELPVWNYQHLLEHFQHMCKFQLFLKNIVLNGLNKLIGNDCFNIWKDILKELQRKQDLDRG